MRLRHCRIVLSIPVKPGVISVVDIVSTEIPLPADMYREFGTPEWKSIALLVVSFGKSSQ